MPREQVVEYVHHYRSPIGGITLASDGEALTGLWFDRQKYFADVLDPEHEEKPLPVFEQAEAWLDLYFSGSVPAFTPPLNMKAASFRKRVWEMLLAIPYGQTMAYGEIAAELAAERGARVSAQAVGGAVGHNAIALIIPCHRVVGKNGRLVGYAGGLKKKAWLLALERRSIAPSLSCADA